MKTLKIIFLLFVNVNIFAQIPSYYNGIDFTNTSTVLFNDLATITINNHQGIPYTSSSTDTWDVLKISDKDPDISSNILLIYGYDDSDSDNNNDRTRNNNQGSPGDPLNWNREHVFAKSLNPSLETGSIGPGTDLHNLRPADAGYNSSRSNRKFTDGSGNSGPQSNGGWYPGDEWKGDVARIVMYMYEVSRHWRKNISNKLFTYKCWVWQYIRYRYKYD
ncbi:endonuclease [Flavicella sp.]|uniref:endonuclease n=1 Tax=Flavicella sp. TaxID=2957742 RepID=UPI0030181AE2